MDSSSAGCWNVEELPICSLSHLYSGDGNSNTTSSFQLPVWTLSLWTLLVDGARNTPSSW